MNQQPLCVDLDDTLVSTDTLAESALRLAAVQPFAALAMPFHLLKGKAALKDWLAERVLPDVPTLPYNEPLLEFIRSEKAAGRQIVLATAAHRSIANAVADHLGCFDEVLSSDARINLKGQTKAQALIERFQAGGFDYVGDSSEDLHVWRSAGRALLPREDAALGERISKEHLPIVRIFQKARPSLLRSLPKVTRLHQWLKNLLVFAPLIASHSILDVTKLLHACLAFLFFGLAASSIYIVNDLMDLRADRRHARKRFRPFASGDVSVKTGLVLAPTLLTFALAGALAFLPSAFSIAVGTYVILTTLYTFYLKRIVIADVIGLAGLYTIRIIAGALAISVMPSFWLLAFSMFVFLCLALMKRFTELRELVKGGVVWAEGRGYQADDLRLLGSLGTSSGYCSVLVLALYINSEEVVMQYDTPMALWLLCPLLMYWLSRLWLITERGQMHEDPVVFAARDRTTWIIGGVGALVLALASIWPL